MSKLRVILLSLIASLFLVSICLIAHFSFFNGILLTYAATEKHLSLAKLFISLGSDIHADNDRAIMMAAFVGDTDMVDLLLDNGADINARMAEPIDMAIVQNHPDTAFYLLKRGSELRLCSDANKLYVMSQHMDERKAKDLRALMTNAIKNCDLDNPYRALKNVTLEAGH